MGNPICLGDFTVMPNHDHSDSLDGGLVAIGSITASGTPSSTTYLRGDGAWETPSGGSMTWPSEAGIAIYAGSNAWGTSLTAPSGTIVGTSDSQALTNKDLTGAGNTFPTFNQNTTGSSGSCTGNSATATTATELSISGQTALLSFTGLASTNRVKTVRDAADTILELGGSYTPTGTWTSMTLVTPTLGTPASGALTNCTFPTLNQNTTGTAFGLASGHAITNTQFPRGLSNRSTTTQGTGQLSASTPVYITNSNISLPASLVTGIGAGTVFQWRFNVGKNANGTGACSILLYYGTHGSTADTAYVTQALPASTAALDTMTVDVQVTFTSTTACSYVIGVTHSAATGAGFGVASGTPAYAGTATGMTTSTGSLIFGIGIQAATGGTLPTYTIGFVQGEAFNLV